MVLEMSAFQAISLELAYKEFRERYVRECGSKIEAYLAKTTAPAEEEKKEAAP